MELNTQTPQTNGNSNGHLLITKKSQPIQTGSPSNGHISIFDPNKYMLKLPKTKKVVRDNGLVGWEKTETDYLPVLNRKPLTFVSGALPLVAWSRDGDLVAGKFDDIQFDDK